MTITIVGNEGYELSILREEEITRKRYKALILLLIALLTIALLTNWYGLGGFSLKTGFPDYPLTLSYYGVIEEDEQEIGSLDYDIFEDKGLPTEEKAILIAQEYLTSKEILPEDAVLEGTQILGGGQYSDGELVKKFERGIEVFYKREINGMPVVGSGDTIYVIIARNQEVVFCFKRWRNLSQFGEVNITSPEEAYDKLLDGNVLGKHFRIEPFEIYNISLGYYSYIEPESQEFYKPVWIFYGKPDGRKYYAVEACE
jgi:hypothetical protein